MLWIQKSRVDISVYKGGRRKGVKENKMVMIQMGKTVCVMVVI